MSVFRPFRTTPVRRTVAVTGGLMKAVTLAAVMWPQEAQAQQTQRVNVAQIGGVTVLPSICDNSTAVNSSFFSIAGTGATNTVIISASTAKTYLCAADLTTRDSTVDVFIVSGDSTNCSTNSTITGFVFSSYSGLTRTNAGFGQWAPISSNAAVCIKTTSSGPVVGSLTFAKRGD